MNQLIQKIENRTARICVIGMGYVGLPLAMAFAEKFRVIGYDVDKKLISRLSDGKSHIKDVEEKELHKYLNETFFPTSKSENLKKCDFYIICTPTPLTNEREPDLSYVKDACETIRINLRKGHFVILESTVYPGTTEEVVVPILEKGGLKAGVDFGVGYSPERVDPGNPLGLQNIPKIVSGVNKNSTNIILKLYKTIITAGVFELGDCKTAEAVKIFENIFREVNIALVNEFSLICEKMGINAWDVIDAATTKPFGFMPFYPGPGVGGHCIPLDPHYLSYKAKRIGIIPRFIELSSEINEFMKIHAVNLAVSGISHFGLKVDGSTFAIAGLAYKKDINDVRESPAKKIIEELVISGGIVKVYDPYVEWIDTNYGKYFSEKNLDNVLNDADCAIFVTDHREIKNKNLDEVVKYMRHPVIIDCRNIFDEISNDGIIYRAIGKPCVI